MVSNKRWKKKTLGSGATGGRHCVKGHVPQVAGGKLLKSDFQKQRIEKETHYKDLGDSLLVSDLQRLHSETETQELCSSSGLVQYRRDTSRMKRTGDGLAQTDGSRCLSARMPPAFPVVRDPRKSQNRI